jgi:uncharacterized damage-inducible protein DinB
MLSSDKYFALHQWKETRGKFEQLLPLIDIQKFIYPGWTLKDLLAHISGWDDAIIISLRAHISKKIKHFPSIQNLDEYNKFSVTYRKSLDYEQVLKEWRLTRLELITLIEQLTEEEFSTPVSIPWGEKEHITSLIDLFHDHEEHHMKDILLWLSHPDIPFKEGG